MQVLGSVLTIGSHLVIPALLVYWIGFRAHASRVGWLVTVAFGVSFMALIHLAGGGWHWVGWYWPYLFWVLLAAAGGWFVVRRWSQLTWWPSKSWRPWTGMAVSAAFTAFFVTSVVGAISAQSAPEETVELEFPLDEGLFYVVHGGSNSATNHHAAVPSQQYALDVVALDSLGIRARGVWPEELEAYEVWDKPVLAPCNGEVVSAEGTMPDLVPPERDGDNPMGNHVAIHCPEPGVTVSLAHLRESSPTVDTGEEVEAGRRIGRVGNSGNTTEPHLHVHAVDGRAETEEQLIREGEGRGMTFQGRFPTRTERIDRR